MIKTRFGDYALLWDLFLYFNLWRRYGGWNIIHEFINKMAIFCDIQMLLSRFTNSTFCYYPVTHAEFKVRFWQCLLNECVCVFVCIHLCVYIWMYIYICIQVYTNTYIHSNMYVFETYISQINIMCICIHACTYIDNLRKHENLKA